uniref:Putative secreted protein n=1 Tax=Anopheles marajoara TaxID=58244 RepID=A0A2M4CC81_9DIPT
MCVFPPSSAVGQCQWACALRSLVLVVLYRRSASIVIGHHSAPPASQPARAIVCLHINPQPAAHLHKLGVGCLAPSQTN